MRDIYLLNKDDPDLAWQEHAECGTEDPALFTGSFADDQAICERCPVRVQCLAYAVRNDERFGIWGGLRAKERQQVSTRRPSWREQFRARLRLP